MADRRQRQNGGAARHGNGPHPPIQRVVLACALLLMCMAGAVAVAFRDHPITPAVFDMRLACVAALLLGSIAINIVVLSPNGISSTLRRSCRADTSPPRALQGRSPS